MPDGPVLRDVIRREHHTVASSLALALLRPTVARIEAPGQVVALIAEINDEESE